MTHCPLVYDVMLPAAVAPVQSFAAVYEVTINEPEAVDTLADEVAELATHSSIGIGELEKDDTEPVQVEVV
jgi:hypothetical protein